MASVKYKPEDTRLIALLGQTTVALYVRKDFPAQTVEQLIAHARKNARNPLSYGSAGAGSLLHLVAERFRAQTGIELLHVPDKGTTPLVQDLIGGQIEMVFLPFGGSMLGMVDSGKVRLLGLAATGRDPRYPHIPMLGESGLLTDFVYDSWLGLQVPRKTPQA
ncbi:MAG: tripartite tricarboxylate transporter substrate-binding protein [Burkholderiaceae bacterium]